MEGWILKQRVISKEMEYRGRETERDTEGEDKYEDEDEEHYEWLIDCIIGEAALFNYYR